jgi:DNA-binding LacI/PurR family transcriptional regulator
MAEFPARASRPSIKDIARAARVSHSTVSRALRGSLLVSAATAGKIRSLAETMGYRPSALARGLVTQKTKTIAAGLQNMQRRFLDAF